MSLFILFDALQDLLKVLKRLDVTGRPVVDIFSLISIKSNLILKINVKNFEFILKVKRIIVKKLVNKVKELYLKICFVKLSSRLSIVSQIILQRPKAISSA